MSLAEIFLVTSPILQKFYSLFFKNEILFTKTIYPKPIVYYGYNIFE